MQELTLINQHPLGGASVTRVNFHKPASSRRSNCYKNESPETFFLNQDQSTLTFEVEGGRLPEICSFRKHDRLEFIQGEVTLVPFAHLLEDPVDDAVNIHAVPIVCIVQFH